MRREDTWRVVAASVALLLVIGLLLSTPSMIFARKVDVIDTELRDNGANPQRVLTKYDLADPKELAKIPKTLGAWNMTKQYAWDNVATLLNTNVLLSRDYARSDLFQPVNLLIIESHNVSSFHPAPVCYRAQGWDLPEGEGELTNVAIQDVSWAQHQWLSPDDVGHFKGNLAARLLTASKIDAHGEPLKRIALYVYLKHEDWRVTQQITWVRVEMSVTPETTAAQAFPILADLLANTVPGLFTFETSDEATLAETLLGHYGPWGWLAVGTTLAAPLGIAAWMIRLSRKGEQNP